MSFYRQMLRLNLLVVRSNAVENIIRTDCLFLGCVRGFLRQDPRSGIAGLSNEKHGKQKTQ